MQIRFIWGLWTALSASALGAQMPADTIRLTLSMKTGQTDNPLAPCGNELLCGRCSPFGNRGALYPAGRVSLPGSQSRFAILYVLAIQYRRAIRAGWTPWQGGGVLQGLRPPASVGTGVTYCKRLWLQCRLRPLLPRPCFIGE